MAKLYPCKLGTKPAFVILRRRYKVRQGLHVEFREVDARGGVIQGNKYQWKRGTINDVTAESGHFFLSQ